jgi:acetyltransferase-like isoleucine patch superfamily enzyme
MDVGHMGAMTQVTELRRCAAAPVLLAMAGRRRLQRRALDLASRFEGGAFRSATMRDVLATRHGVVIGAYSYGACFEPGAFPGGARIGRYVSMASGVKRRLDHPLDRLVLHPYFYNEHLGYVAARTIQHQPITIGHDAWIGENVIFTEGCRRVGVGAAIGAGSVVTRDVDDFMVVAGVPARPLRRRFDEELAARIRASAWWERPVEELAAFTQDLGLPVTAWPADHPLLAGR